MNLYNYNEMFILALVALSIVGVVCLGLLAVLAIFVLGQRHDKGLLGNNPPNTVNPPQSNTPQPPNQLQDALDKLDSVKKEMVLGTNIAISGLAFAFIVYAISIVYKNVLQGFVVVILASIMLMLGSPNNRKWITENYRRFRWLFYLIVGILIIIAILAIRFVYVIPI